MCEIDINEVAKTKRRKQAIQTDEYAFYVKIDRDMPFPDFSTITFFHFSSRQRENHRKGVVSMNAFSSNVPFHKSKG